MHNKAIRTNMTLTDLVINSVVDKGTTVLEGFILLRRELYSVGNNLTQLSTLANMGRITLVDLTETHKELDRCHEALDQIRDRVYK